MKILIAKTEDGTEVNVVLKDENVEKFIEEHEEFTVTDVTDKGYSLTDLVRGVPNGKFYYYSADLSDAVAVRELRKDDEEYPYSSVIDEFEKGFHYLYSYFSSGSYRKVGVVR